MMRGWDDVRIGLIGGWINRWLGVRGWFGGDLIGLYRDFFTL
jgi:hypothetical protein